MSNLIPVDEQSVFERKGRPVTNSVKVAQYFGKRHNNVMRDIRESECSDDFRALNFEQSSYVDEQGKRQPMFNMTKDGFFFIAMGFTGKKAAIIADKAEAWIKKQQAEIAQVCGNGWPVVIRVAGSRVLESWDVHGKI